MTAEDGRAADAVIRAMNDTEMRTDLVGAYVYATVSTDSFDETAQGLLSELEVLDSRCGRCWPVSPSGSVRSASTPSPTVSTEVAEHRGPLSFLAARAEHQMAESEEGLVRRAQHHRLDGVGAAARRRHVAADRGRRAAGRRRRRMPMAAIRGLATDADPRDSQGGVRGRAARLADRRRDVRGGHERASRARPTSSTAAWLGQPDRGVAVRQQRQPGDLRRDAVGGRRIAARLPPLDARQGPAARTRRRHCRGTTSFAPLPSAPRSASRGRRAWTSSAVRSRRTASRSAGSSTAPSTSSGSTPAHAKASAAARSACRSSTTARSCSSTGAAASTPRRPRRTSSATRTTTPSSPTARALQRHMPMALAETASIFCETLGGRGGAAAPRRARIAWRCSTSTCWAPCRRSSTSAAGSPSRPRCSPVANAERSACRSSTR